MSSENASGAGASVVVAGSLATVIEERTATEDRGSILAPRIATPPPEWIAASNAMATTNANTSNNNNSNNSVKVRRMVRRTLSSPTNVDALVRDSNSSHVSGTTDSSNPPVLLEAASSSRSRRRKRKPSAPTSPTAADAEAAALAKTALSIPPAETAAAADSAAVTAAAAALSPVERHWRQWFVESCGLDEAEATECTNLFIHARITPDQTVALTHDLLKEVGVRHVGVRMCIVGAPAPRPFLGGTLRGAHTSSEDLATVSSSASSPRKVAPKKKSSSSSSSSRHAASVPPIASVAAAAAAAVAATATAASPGKQRRRRTASADKPLKSTSKIRSSASSPLRVSDTSPRGGTATSAGGAAARGATDDNDYDDVLIEERVVLNVGGTRFETYLSTLTRYPNTTLGAMFSERNRPMLRFNKEGEVFFDRSPALFEPILAFYRSGVLRRPPHVDPRLFADECAFFGVTGAKRGAPRLASMSFLGFGDEYDASEDSLGSYDVSDAWLDEWTDDEGVDMPDSHATNSTANVTAAASSSSATAATTTGASSSASLMSQAMAAGVGAVGASPPSTAGMVSAAYDDLSPSVEELHQSIASLATAGRAAAAFSGSAPSSPPPPARPGASPNIPIPSGSGGSRRAYASAVRSSSPPLTTSARTSGRDADWPASPPLATSPQPLGMQSSSDDRREQRQAALALQMRRHGAHRLGALMATRSMSRLRRKVKGTLRRLLRHVVIAVRRAADVGNPTVTVEFREGLQSEFYGFLSNLACRELALHELLELQFDVAFSYVTSAGGGHSYVFVITLWNSYTGHESLNVRVTLNKVLDELRFISSIPKMER
jgi:hypothetical protein